MDFLLFWTIVLLVLITIIGSARRLGNVWTDLMIVPLAVVSAGVLAFVFCFLLLLDVIFLKKTVVDEAVVDYTTFDEVDGETTFYFTNHRRKVTPSNFKGNAFEYIGKPVEILKVEARFTGYFSYETIRLS